MSVAVWLPGTFLGAMLLARHQGVPWDEAVSWGFRSLMGIGLITPLLLGIVGSMLQDLWHWIRRGY